MTTLQPRSRRAWVMLSMLVVAALACNMGSPDPADIQPTSEPRPRATATTELDIDIPDIEDPVDDPEEDDPPVDPSGDGLTRSERENLIASTVQIFGLFEQDGELMIGYTGSGTLISEEGLILTNAHVASPASQGDTEYEPDALGVALVQAEDEPPVASYIAEVHAVDGYLDLAVIRIVGTLDGDDIDGDDLNLPFVELGDSDDVRVGDHINIFGFPGIGGETLTFTTGNVSGFTAEEQLGNRAWIKTDATISGGNSGGLGADDEGVIIGVPTIASSGADGDITDCRVVQDTNGDGQLDENDTCVPIGGFINALRPINLALPLIEAAEEGLAYESPYTSGQAIADGGGDEQMSEITWYSVDSEGNLDEPVSSYPSGSGVVVATFAFEGMTDGQEWGEVWWLGDEEVYQDTYAWDQGDEGEYYTWLSANEGALEDGEYSVAIFVGPDGRVLTESSVTVGGGGGVVDPNGQTDPPAEGEILVFGTVTDGDTGQPIEGAYFIVLNPGVVYAAWDGSEDDIYTVAQTGEDGSFLLPDLLERGVEYTIVVGARGYQTKFGDGLVWTPEDSALYVFDVDLVR